MNTDHDGAFGSEPQEDQRKEIGRLMLRGAGLACAVIFGPIICLYLIYLVGLTLPPESKEAEDPTPDSFVRAES